MTFYLTSDTHFNHEKVKEYCGRPDDYERKIFKGLSAIPAGDTLIHLGDICIGADEAVHGKWIFPLACKKILVRGNHDRKSVNWYLEHGWDVVCDGLRLALFGEAIMLSHVPLKEDGWFTVNIHGHFHNTDHRNTDPAFNAILTDKHKLLALEHTHYQPVKLESFISKT